MFTAEETLSFKFSLKIFLLWLILSDLPFDYDETSALLSCFRLTLGLLISYLFVWKDFGPDWPDTPFL